jgi:hypothetical protein
LRETKLLLVDQLTNLAEAFAESLTPERLDIYTNSLVDLQLPQLAIAFKRALCELRFFPKISELRDLAGFKAEDQRKVEAEAAWKYANDYLRKWGVERLPERSGGRWIVAPDLPARIDYALRRIGGLWGLNQVTSESYPFKYKEFCEAYELAPMADFLAPQLQEKFPAAQLLGDLQRHLTDGKSDKPGSCVRPISRPQFVAKKIPEPLTESQIRDRREMLRQQRDKLQGKPVFAGVLQ